MTSQHLCERQTLVLGLLLLLVATETVLGLKEGEILLFFMYMYVFLYFVYIFCVCLDPLSNGCPGNAVELGSDVTACAGAWTGASPTTSRVCAEGWQVCGGEHLKNIREFLLDEPREGIPGCYAFNLVIATNNATCYSCERFHGDRQVF